MRCRIDFALHDLRRALHGQRADAFAQLFTSALRHRGDVVLGRCLLAVDLGDGVSAGLLQNLVGLLLRAIDDLGSLLARLLDLGSHFVVGVLQLGVCPLGGIEAFGDLDLSLFDGLGEMRPNEVGAEPDQDGECDHFADQGGVEIPSLRYLYLRNVTGMSAKALYEVVAPHSRRHAPRLSDQQQP